MSPCVRISPNEYETMCCLQAILERTSHKIEELHLDGNSVTDSGVKALQRESKWGKQFTWSLFFLVCEKHLRSIRLCLWQDVKEQLQLMRGLKFISFGWTLIGNEAAKAVGVVWWSGWWWSVMPSEPVRCSQKLLGNRKTCRCPWAATRLVQKGWRCRYHILSAWCADCQEAVRPHAWSALARH